MNKDTKITIVSHYAMPHIGGIEQVAEKQAKFLKEKGFNVSILATASSEEEPGEEITKDGVFIKRFPAWTMAERSFSIPFPIVGIKSLYYLWRSVGDSDIVHIHDVFYQPCWFAALFAWMQNKPIFLTQHVAMVEHKSFVVTLIQRFVYGLIGRAVFGLAKKIVVYNNHVYKFLVDYGVAKDKIIEARNGIDFNVFYKGADNEKKAIRVKYNLPTDKKLVLFVGRMVSKKGYDILYNARDSGYDIAFVGSGDVPEEWGKAEGVYFLGPKSESELSEIYRCSDLFVFPSEGEVFTLVMQEAMASGLPVITTYDRAYDIYGDIKESGVLFSKRNSGELQKNIINIIKNEELINEMSEHSIKFAKKYFDWRENIQKVVDMYKIPKAYVTTSWDDGHKLDIKLAKLLKKYNILGTFYISPKSHEITKDNRLSENEIVELSKNFEIGAHTFTHRHLTSITFDEVKKEIESSKKWLEDVVQKNITSFCYPAGKYKKIHKKIIRELGFNLARTVKRFVFVKSADRYELATSVHTYDHFLDIWNLLKFVKFNPITFLKVYRKWDKQAIMMFDRVKMTGGVFHLWGHSWEIEKHKDWERLEKVLEHISNHKGVGYINNSELYE